MLIGERGRGNPEVPRAVRPAGIIVFERLQPQPKPRLQPYIWSREHNDHPALPGMGKVAGLGALMVGSIGSLPRGVAVRAV